MLCLVILHCFYRGLTPNHEERNDLSKAFVTGTVVDILNICSHNNLLFNLPLRKMSNIVSRSAMPGLSGVA